MFVLFFKSQVKLIRVLEQLLSKNLICFAYNNGIAATAEKIKFVVEDGVKYIKEIVGFQIVNGGQTTASIHRAKK